MIEHHNSQCLIESKSRPELIAIEEETDTFFMDLLLLVLLLVILHPSCSEVSVLSLRERLIDCLKNIVDCGLVRVLDDFFFLYIRLLGIDFSVLFKLRVNELVLLLVLFFICRFYDWLSLSSSWLLHFEALHVFEIRKGEIKFISLTYYFFLGVLMIRQNCLSHQPVQGLFIIKSHCL
jgi:hypothetical protein